ncbi:ornithine cyclodeaminase [Jannaschia pagri]|uniref:Ornithine cyclodeaminase n=1 Tax=Jannaschia pagri TaxID=2829797 RepID=A0ABQ4NQF3_9RHOB|nr:MULTISPECIES: ornithine cyclodeaminase [unclassified Jannaschia]GIT92569.1 ornithine cyclodeaminase [Jannaschia sp. AI_61]GIT96571.1 ornithine cyclodeaminase [Jannaschia sp. AI_62]
MNPSPPTPSSLAMVPFVSVEHMMRLINEMGIAETIAAIADRIEADFLRWERFDKVARVPSHSETGVIELMPTSDGEFYGFKYVNGHPANMARGYQTVTAFGVLARVDTGYPVMVSEMTILTALRTAAMSVVAARHLAPKDGRVMAIIGNGAQCEFQALGFHHCLGIEEVRLWDLEPAATAKAARNLRETGLTVVACTSAEAAIEGAQIITTCTADKRQATILTDNMVGAGVHLNAIGGDCPGKTEFHRDILLRSDIFVEYAPQTRIEGEIQQLPAYHPVTDLWRVIAGQRPGRTSAHQTTLFDSVGFATEDFSALCHIYDEMRRTGYHTELDLLADPDDPRDLFGMVRRGGGGQSFR